MQTSFLNALILETLSLKIYVNRLIEIKIAFYRNHDHKNSIYQ